MFFYIPLKTFKSLKNIDKDKQQENPRYFEIIGDGFSDPMSKVKVGRIRSC